MFISTWVCVVASVTTASSLSLTDPYHDPAKGIEKGEQALCTERTKNHVDRVSKTLVPPGLKFDVAKWAVEYDAAMQADDTEALQRLRNTGEGYEMDPPMGQHWFDYIQIKTHMLDVLQHQMGLEGELWLPRSSLLDIGTGHGYLAAFLVGRYGISAVGYDIPFSYQCKTLMASPLTVNLYDGKAIPEGNRSFDAVSFMSVLHHAATNTPALLRQAAQIARTYILVIEDLEVGTEVNHKHNMKHDPNGIFRSDTQWREVFRNECPDFEVVKSGPVGGIVKNHGVAIGTEKSNRLDEIQGFYVLKRLGSPCVRGLSSPFCENQR